MGININIGPYEITSDDNLLSQDDWAVDTSTNDIVTLFDVADYIKQFSAEYAACFTDGFLGSSRLYLENVQTYFDSILNTPPQFTVTHQGETTLPLCGEQKIQKEIYTVNGVNIPVSVGQGLYCQNEPASYDEEFLKQFGKVKYPASNETWNNQFGNCYAYATHAVLNFPPSVSINDSHLSFNAIPDLQHPGQSFVVSEEKGANGMETILSSFYNPVAFIPSSSIPVTSLANRILASTSPEVGLAQLNDGINQLFDDALNSLVRAGKLDLDKVKRGEYIVVFTQKMLWEKPEGDSSMIMPKHAGILRFENGHWRLEAKLGFGMPVVESSLGTHALTYSMGAVQDGYTGDLFYRIYEPRQNGSKAAIDFKPLIQAEPLSTHDILLRKLVHPTAQAQDIVSRVNAALGQ